MKNISQFLFEILNDKDLIFPLKYHHRTLVKQICLFKLFQNKHNIKTK